MHTYIVKAGFEFKVCGIDVKLANDVKVTSEATLDMFIDAAVEEAFAECDPDVMGG